MRQSCKLRPLKGEGVRQIFQDGTIGWLKKQTGKRIISCVKNSVKSHPNCAKLTISYIEYYSNVLVEISLFPAKINLMLKIYLLIEYGPCGPLVSGDLRALEGDRKYSASSS